MNQELLLSKYCYVKVTQTKENVVQVQVILKKKRKKRKQQIKIKYDEYFHPITGDCLKELERIEVVQHQPLILSIDAASLDLLSDL